MLRFRYYCLLNSSSSSHAPATPSRVRLGRPSEEDVLIGPDGEARIEAEISNLNEEERKLLVETLHHKQGILYSSHDNVAGV